LPLQQLSVAAAAGREVLLVQQQSVEQFTSGRAWAEAGHGSCSSQQGGKCLQGVHVQSI
jgi:hypothetical protein